MKTLRLHDGDLVPAHRDYGTVRGSGKVIQDLRGALLEPIGNDRFHPGWGSSLNDFIATIANEDTRLAVESEVTRVITNLAAIQRDKIQSDITSGGETRFTTDEVLSAIQGVVVEVEGESVAVDISVRLLSGEIVVLAEAVL